MLFATLRSRIVGLLILTSVLLAGALAVVIGSWVSDSVKAEIGSALTDRAIGLAASLDREMATRIDELMVLASLDTFKSLSRPDRIRTLLESLQRSIPRYSWVGVLDPTGTVVAATGGVLEGKNIAQRPVFQEGIRGMFVGDVHEAVLLANLLPNPTGEPVKFVDIAVRLDDPASGVVGVLAAHMSWAWAREIETETMTRLDDRPALQTFVVSEDRSILLAPDRRMHGQTLDLPIVGRAQAGRAGWEVVTWPDGRDYVTGYAPARGTEVFSGLGWIVVSRQPVADAFAPVFDLMRSIAVVGVGFAALAALLGYAAATSIVAPLNRIVNAAEAIRRNRGGRFSAVDGPAEIRAVSNAIEDLVDTVFEKDEALAELQSLAYRDPLTGLANRAALELFLKTGKSHGRPYAVACIDLDEFKAVNDNHGHATGDEVLRTVASRLEGCVRGGDLLIRHGGDEFIAILQMPAPDREGPARRVGNRIVDEIGQPFMLAGGRVDVGASVGLAFFPRDGEDLPEVLKRADDALYRAKRLGRRRIEVFAGPAT